MPKNATSTADPASRHCRRDFAVGLLVSILCGVLLASMPHLVAWYRTGSTQFISDGDDQLYLAISRGPYWGEWTLRDPFAARSQHLTTPFAGALFIPPAKIARWLGFSPLQIGLVWRILGGALLAVSLFALTTRILSALRFNRKTVSLTATALAVLLLSDPGLLTGQPLLGDVHLLHHLMTHTMPPHAQSSLGQYRVISPLLDLPWLLLLLASLIPDAQRKHSGWRIACGGLALAMCVYTYFYFWTASFIAIGILLSGYIVLAFLRPKDRAGLLIEIKVLLATLMIGLVLGAPQIISNARLSRRPEFQQALQRMARGMRLLPGDPMRSLYIRNFAIWIVLAAGAFILLRCWQKRRKEGISLEPSKLELFAPISAVLCAFTLSGYLLKNVGLAGLEFENYHWVMVHGPATEVFFLIVILLACPRRTRVLQNVTIVLAVLLFAFGLVWRGYETVNDPLAQANAQTLIALRPLRATLTSLSEDDVIAGPPQANVALLFGRAGELFMSPHTLHGSLVTDQEANERHALNAWLMGESEQDYIRDSRPSTGIAILPSSQLQWSPDVVQKARVAIFEQIVAENGGQMLDRYRPTVLLLPSSAVKPTRGGPWAISASADEWNVWIHR